MIYFLLIGVILFFILGEIRKRYGVTISRNAWAVLVGGVIIHCLVTGSWLLVAFNIVLLCFATYSYKTLDNEGVKSYKELAIAYHQLVKQGWGEVYKAQEMKRLLDSIWQRLPNKKHQELDEWVDDTFRSEIENPEN